MDPTEPTEPAPKPQPPTERTPPPAGPLSSSAGPSPGPAATTGRDPAYDQPAARAVTDRPQPSTSSNTAPMIVGAVTALIVLSLFAWFIYRDRGATEASPTTTPPNTPLTTTAPTASLAVGPGGQYTPLYTEASCEFNLATDVDYTCGWLTVPEDRDNPANGRQVQLHVAVFESPAENAPDDPIVYLDGGPGGESLDPLALTFAQLWRPLLDDRDLIMFDQRGIGLSTPSLDCPEETEYGFSQLDRDLANDEERAGELAAIEECRDRLLALGIDLSQYNSADIASDVADLRIAMGIDEWNLLGISYGTRLAETIMRDHPEGIRSVILDSTYTPQVNLIAEGPRNLDRSLSKLWSGCEEDVECAVAFPNLEERFFNVVDQLEASPIASDVRDFLGGGSWEVLFDGDWVLGTVFQGLYSEKVIPLLPQMIAELESGVTATISLLASNTLANAGFFSLGMNLSVQCNEEVAFTTPEEIAEGQAPYPRIQSVFDGSSNIGDFMFEACGVWQAGRADQIETQPIESGIPTLVLSGEYDPITPPRWGADAAANLTNSTYIEFPGLGHGTSISGSCPLGIVFDFLADPATPPDEACVADMGGIDFRVPGATAAPISLVPFTETVIGSEISGVIPEGWTSLGFGAYARGDSAIDQTAIIQQLAPLVGPDQLVSLFAQQFDMDAAPEPTSTRDSELGEWNLWRGDAGGFSVDIAAIDLGSSSAVIILISDPDERDELLGQLLLPAIDAFRTG